MGSNEPSVLRNDEHFVFGGVLACVDQSVRLKSETLSMAKTSGKIPGTHNVGGEGYRPFDGLIPAQSGGYRRGSVLSHGFPRLKN
jgi:hypothetical protein